MARAVELTSAGVGVRWRRLPFFAAASAVIALGPCAAAQPQQSASGTEPVVEVRDTRAWLGRIQDAANKRNYQGTVVVSAGGTVASSRIAHFCEGSEQYERIDSLDGQMRHVFRQNDVVHTVWPQNKVAMVEQREGVSSFPALLQQGSDRIPEFYDMRLLSGVERVAGRESQVLVLKPKDANRYGYRLWVDQASGLLLRSEVLNERYEVLESSACSRSCFSPSRSSTATACSSPPSCRPSSKPRAGNSRPACPASSW
jgi:sigma-E factor negative regulatory protein RseB